MKGLDGWQNLRIYANWLYKKAVGGTDLLMDCDIPAAMITNSFFEIWHYEQFRWFQRQYGLQFNWGQYK